MRILRFVKMQMSRITGIVLFLCLAIGMPAQDRQDPPKVVKINDSVSMAPLGANVYLVKTSAGNVVIDTCIADRAPQARKLLGAESHAAVRYIILTHGHADHIGGIDLWKEPGTQIIAQRNYVELVNYVSRLEGFFVPRNAAAFNRTPAPVGPWAGNFGAKIDPTILFDETYKFSLEESSSNYSARRVKHPII